MHLWNWFSKSKTNVPAPVKFPLDKVEKAFTVDGVDYYQYRDPADMSIARWEAALDRQSEIENRVTNEYLKLHCKLVGEALKKNDLQEVAYLNVCLQERASYLSNVEFLYNLASVWYFDQNEDLYGYSFEYADEKIKHWQKEKQVLDFFFASPLRNYIAYPAGLEMSIEDYSRGVLTEEKARLSGVFRRLSKKNADPDIMSSISSRMEKLKAWTEYLK